MSRKKDPLGNFDQNVYFIISWMCIILRLICEVLSGTAVDIRFLWDSKHSVYWAASFIAIVTSWYLHKYLRKFTSVILYMNIICFAQWLFGANLEIYTVPMRLQDVINIINQNVLSCKHVSIFFRENMTAFLNYVTAMLRTLYAAHIILYPAGEATVSARRSDIFCVHRLNIFNMPQ